MGNKNLAGDNKILHSRLLVMGTLKITAFHRGVDMNSVAMLLFAEQQNVAEPGMGALATDALELTQWPLGNLNEILDM